MTKPMTAAVSNGCQRCASMLMRSGVFLADGEAIMESGCIACGDRTWASRPYKGAPVVPVRDGTGTILAALDDRPDVVDLRALRLLLDGRAWTLEDVEVEVRKRGYVVVAGSGTAYRCKLAPRPQRLPPSSWAV